jgi:response regulator RpfG family c-di-GMP phosphodiesterase
MFNPLINRPTEDDETVLLVATHPTFLSDYRPLLSEHFTCLTATSFAEAIQLLQKVPVKALLLAEKLPNENSIGFIRTAHRIKPDIQKVLLAEHVDTKMLITALNEGSLFRCLLVPIAPVALVRAMKDALRRYEMERVQRELADHAAEIDLYLHSIPY